MPDIRLTALSKRFGHLAAVEDITMTFAEGTVTCLLGPSGCGKTTLPKSEFSLRSAIPLP